MFWAKRLKQCGLVLLAVSAFAIMGCSSDSSSDKKKSSGPTDSATGSTAAGSVQSALSAALAGDSGSTNTGLLANGPIPAKLVNAIMAQPGVGPIGGIGGGNAATVGPVTETLDFTGGPYPCAVSGTVGASGTVSYTYSYSDALPYSYDDDFSTTDPLALTLAACSDGLWTLDGDVTYEVSEVLSLDSVDGSTWTFSYDYGDSFDASVTGTEIATSEEASLEMTYALTGALDGSFDSSGDFTFTTYDWTYDLTINGESYSCSATDPDVEATCE